jgi:hypothetical protein
MAAFGAYAADTAVLKEEDLNKADTLVEDSAVIQDAHSKCTDEKMKEEFATKYHTTRRSFDQCVCCCVDDVEEWKATARGGRVFKLALVQKLWFDNKFSFDKKDIPRVPALSFHDTELRKAL